MKSITKYIMFSAVLMGLTSCNENSIFEGELYKKVVYVLSETDLTYSVTHSLNTPSSVGYITIYAGGTTAIDQDVTVTLEKDPDLIDKYNHDNFDLDESKYAKELAPSRYTIKDYTAVMKVGNQDPYVKLPIEVRVDGLSPDSTYLIPLRIASCTPYEVNNDKSRVLYRVYIENDFTSQKNPLTLFMRGTQLRENETKPVQISANKVLYPLTKRGVRLNAAIENSGNKADEELINKSSLIMEIGEEELTSVDGFKYNTLKLKPYNPKLIEVVQLPGVNDNDVQLSVEEANRYITVDETTRFYLSYKYRTLKTAADGDTPAEWNPWVEVHENMKVPTDN
ncbi:BT_3987 domain-containing protein [uncultured Bacteroides sp.]|uniref:BT_3987 domain-containing protein n=1 Tax=uncultured Bacteroides sp. TaxID=162156 RepID=UPI0025E5F66E|nr:DUF1735 domain-containing protein [uncultured Bacteroides sp.]